MGREIRKVPAGWSHPRYDKSNTEPALYVRLGQYRPLFDSSFEEAMREWVDGWEAWNRGERPSYYVVADYPDGISFAEWDGGPPALDAYRPQWTEDERTHFQFYETVSEGTPLSPPMPSLEMLATWLTENQDEWGEGPRTKEQAEAFCKSGWAPSFVMDGRGIRPGLEALVDIEDARTDVGEEPLGR